MDSFFDNFFGFFNPLPESALPPGKNDTKEECFTDTQFLKNLIRWFYGSDNHFG